MRSFIFAVTAAIVLAAAARPTLEAIQQSAAQAETTGAARLDQQESVNNYGREG